MFKILMLTLATSVMAGTNPPAHLERAEELGLPIAMMNASNQLLVADVAEKCTLQRNVPPRRFPGHAENFAFMLDHMFACSILAEMAGVISYRPQMTEDGRLHADNKQEAEGFLVQVCCDEGRRIYYVEGTQRGAFATHGRGVVVVEFKQVTPEEVEYSGQVFVRIDNTVTATLAKMFFVFLRRSVDDNFVHVMTQPRCMAQLVTENPDTLRTIIAESPVDDYQIISPLKPLLPPASK